MGVCFLLHLFFDFWGNFTPALIRRFIALQGCKRRGRIDTSCTLVFKWGHAIFLGHFPGSPVVPEREYALWRSVKELLQRQVERAADTAQHGECEVPASW